MERGDNVELKCVKSDAGRRRPVRASPRADEEDSALPRDCNSNNEPGRKESRADTAGSIFAGLLNSKKLPSFNMSRAEAALVRKVGHFNHF